MYRKGTSAADIKYSRKGILCQKINKSTLLELFFHMSTFMNTKSFFMLE